MEGSHYYQTKSVMGDPINGSVTIGHLPNPLDPKRMGFYDLVVVGITPHWKNWLLRVYLVFREYLFFVNGTNVSFTVNDEVQFYADEKQCRRPSMDLQMQNFFLPNFAYLKIHKHSHYKHFFMHNKFVHDRDQVIM